MSEPRRQRGALVSVAAPPGTGKSTVLPQVPDRVPASDGVTLIGWEVDDTARADRLRRRDEPDGVIADALFDARTLRGLLPPARIVRTGPDDTPGSCADALWAVARRHLGQP